MSGRGTWSGGVTKPVASASRGPALDDMNALLLVWILGVGAARVEADQKAAARSLAARRAAAKVRSRVVRWGRGDRVVGKRGNMRRQRMCWATRVAQLTADGITPFLKRYKVSPTRFQEIADAIRPLVEHEDVVRAQNANHGEPPISAELQLSMTLRYLAGSHHLDILMDLHGVGSSTVHSSISKTLAAINFKFKHLLRFPVDNPHELQQIASL